MQTANIPYLLHEKPPTFYPTNLFKDIDAHQAARKNASKNIAKILLKERISGRFGGAFDSGSPSYLEHNAQTRGEIEKANKNLDFRYAENLKNVCGKSVIWLQGATSDNFYIKKIDCRKSWCPVCGGKGGKIHNSRLHAILKRADFDKYDLRQFVFTVPMACRDLLMYRENLDQLVKSAKSVIAKHFGEPVFDKNGHVKKYNLKKAVVLYVHLFGEEKGIYKPHINIHILEEKNQKLKLELSVLENIKKSWLKELRKIDQQAKNVDVHYSFRNNIKKNIHSVKYMAKPYGEGDYNMIKDDKLKQFLAVEMKGFQYIRFYGALANCNYKDEMELPEQVEEVENKAGEKLVPLFIAPYDEAAWDDKLEKLDDGFYRIRRKDCIDYIQTEQNKKKL